MKGLGKGVKDFKDEVAGVSTDDKQETSDPKDDK